MLNEYEFYCFNYTDQEIDGEAFLELTDAEIAKLKHFVLPYQGKYIKAENTRYNSYLHKNKPASTHVHKNNLEFVVNRGLEIGVQVASCWASSIFHMLYVCTLPHSRQSRPHWLQYAN